MAAQTSPEVWDRIHKALEREAAKHGTTVDKVAARIVSCEVTPESLSAKEVGKRVGANLRQVAEMTGRTLDETWWNFGLWVMHIYREQWEEFKAGAMPEASEDRVEYLTEAVGEFQRFELVWDAAYEYMEAILPYHEQQQEPSEQWGQPSMRQ